MNSLKGLPRLRKERLLLFAIVFFLAALPVVADSLWEPGFKGYITDTADIQAGDLVRVRIAIQNNFSLNTLHSDSQEVRFGFEGGEGSSLFSFLPQGSSSGSQTVEEEGGYELSTGLVAEVVEELDNGRYRVRGSRTVVINDKREELVVEGELSPEAIKNGEVDFSRIAKARLTYTAIGMGEELALEEGDFERPDEGETPNGSQNDGDSTAAAAEGVGGESDAAAARQGYSLAEEKREELLRRYMRRILDILFQQ